LGKFNGRDAAKSLQKPREELATIRRRCAALPVIDDRPAEKILGYDERGLPA